MSKDTRSKGFSKIVILALVLFVPGFLYLLLENMGTNEYVKLPVYGEKRLSGEMRSAMGREIPDTLFHQLEPMVLTNWDGKQVSFLGSDSVITVAHLFYTRDQAFSSIMLEYLDQVATKFQNNELVQLFSLSVDPEDAPAMLKKAISPFTQRNRWFVTTAPESDLLTYAREQMLLDGMRDPGDSTKFIIGNQFILIDSHRRIRGFYPVSEHTEIKRLEDEIKLQLVEEIRNRPLKIEKK